MHSFAEKPFTINGVNSWIHCLDCFQVESADKMKEQNYHYHDYIEFLYALDADVNVWISGVPHRMVTGELVIINSGEMHTLSFNKNSRYICVKFSPKVLYFDDNSLFEFKYVTPFLSDGAHQKLFSRDDFEGVDISEHFDSVTEGEVASFCGLSYNHFSTAFKKSVGRSFNDYVTLIRLNEAERLIVSSDKSITEIAYSCGFSSTSHFIARFKSQKGVTPYQLRKRVR